VGLVAGGVGVAAGVPAIELDWRALIVIPLAENPPLQPNVEIMRVNIKSVDNARVPTPRGTAI
jgi:hypothetical protein